MTTEDIQNWEEQHEKIYVELNIHLFSYKRKALQLKWQKERKIIEIQKSWVFINPEVSFMK